MDERHEQHIHYHLKIEGLGGIVEALLTDRGLLREILHKLTNMETNMATIADLNTAVDGIQGVLTANDARVAALATAVSDAAANSAAHDAALDAEIKRLQDLIAAGGDPAALQVAVDKIAAMSTEAVTQGTALDAATTALASAFPPPPPGP